MGGGGGGGKKPLPHPSLGEEVAFTFANPGAWHSGGGGPGRGASRGGGRRIQPTGVPRWPNK